eukprot:CAMPEP_0167824634 /NCGR_PEP_ID=MMETSP0112_2-20121227/8904_1 /TAXON_ID=91324 /ORGANISM="Lotharella globosa, Strain CCCM811" /LENGTH=1413 /DNA_ID=CAMNT_0007726621 /DNA_START=91 /DNA_END=4332 /DNA_ORIENTATION=+
MSEKKGDGLSGLLSCLASLKHQSLYVEELKGVLEKDKEEIFAFTSSGWGPSSTIKAPIGAIGVKVSKKDAPSGLGFMPIKTTVLGKKGMLQGKDREVMLMYKPAEKNQVPITAVGLLSPATNQVPYGFTPVIKGVLGDKYHAEVVTNDGKSPPMYFCVEREPTGAHLSQVGVTLEEDTPALPKGVFRLVRTIGGGRADIGKNIFLCYVQDTTGILGEFKAMGREEGAVLGAAVTCCVTSGQDRVIGAAVRFLAEMDPKLPGISARVFDRCVSFLCEQGIIICCGVPEDDLEEFIRLLGYILMKFKETLTVTSYVHALFLCTKLHSLPPAQKLGEYLRAKIIDLFTTTTNTADEELPPLKDFSLPIRAHRGDKVDVKTGRRKVTALEGEGFANPDADEKTSLGSPMSILEDGKAKASMKKDTCAEEEGEGEGAPPPKLDQKELTDVCRKAVLAIVSRIERELLPSHSFDDTKSWVPHVHAFFKDPTPTLEFYRSVDGATKAIKNPNDKILVAHVLVYCKIASEPNRSQAALRRRIQALKRLRDILGASAEVWAHSEHLSAILKRFVSLSLVKCAAVDAHRSYDTGRPSLLKEVLKCLILITHKFKSFMAPQLGTILEEVILPLLTGPYVSISHKNDMLSMLMRMMSTHQACVNVYYNYDNHTKGRKLFQKIIESVAHVVEGETEGKRAADAKELRTSGMKFLVHVLKVLADRCDSFVTAASGQIHPSLLAHAKHQQREKLRHGNQKGVKKTRRSTWTARQMMQAKDKKIEETAVRKVKSDSVKAAVKYLRACNHALITPQGLAEFLYSYNEKLDQKKIGDYIGCSGKTDEEKKYFKELRRHFFRHTPFAGQTLVAAVRMLLESGGFYLPGEGQKIGEIISTFSEVYFSQNPGKFAQVDDVEVLAYQIVMLNTDLHRPLKKKSDKRMTLDELCKNLKGMCDRKDGKGKDFSRSLLESIFNEVKARAFKWKRDPTVNEGTAAPDRQEFFSLISTKAETQLAATALVFQTYRSSQSSTIARGLFDVCWWHVASTIDHLMKTMPTVEVMHLCLDGVKHGARLGIRLAQETERKAFLRILAEVHFVEVERAKEKAQKNKPNRKRKGKTLAMRLANNEHERALWFRRLNMQVKRNHDKALEILEDVVEETKQRVAHDKEQQKLTLMQHAFGNDIILVEPARRYILDDKLTKISDRTNKKEEYTFFLFSDILIYGKKASGSTYKVHQVLHLSLARLIDYLKPKSIRGQIHSHVFKVDSPQKSFLISCADASQKARWVHAIVDAIEEVMRRRKVYLETQLESTVDATAGSEPESSSNLQVMSSWIATSEMDLFGKGDGKKLEERLQAVHPAVFVDHAEEERVLVLQGLGVLRVSLSEEPSAQGGQAEALCDACFGFLNGLVSGTYETNGRKVSVPILTREAE